MFRVLFLSSGNSEEGISPLVYNQGKSLEKAGINVDFYTIKGKGIQGYLRNIAPLRKFLSKNKYDLIHAHFSLTGMLASLAGAKPIVVSLMGWNVKLWYYKLPILIFNWLSWDACIVKSESMNRALGLNKNIFIIPNGIDTEKFKPISKNEALERTGWDNNKKNILFAANPNRPVKLYYLAREAFTKLNREDVILHYLAGIDNNDMPYYYSSSDVVLLTSKAEGSPNVIKEAMACGRPIVTTRVGDVESLLHGVEASFITSYDSNEIASAINKALLFQSSSNSRSNIDHLEEEKIAERIISVYKSVLIK